MLVNSFLTRRAATAFMATLLDGRDLPSEVRLTAGFAARVDHVLAGSHWVLRTFIWTQFLFLEVSPLLSRARCFSGLDPSRRRAWLEWMASSRFDGIRRAFLVIKVLGHSLAYTDPETVLGIQETSSDRSGDRA